MTFQTVIEIQLFPSLCKQPKNYHQAWSELQMDDFEKPTVNCPRITKLVYLKHAMETLDPNKVFRPSRAQQKTGHVLMQGENISVLLDST